jgi:hypothetical protein
MAFFSIPSSELTAASSNKLLFEFLTDFKNFKSILPEDKADNFSCDEHSCSFNIKGITPMKVVLTGKHPYNKIIFNSEGLGKFNFNLVVNFIGGENEIGSCSIELSGDLNPFIKTMAEKPLTGLVNSMNQKLANLKLT